MAKVLYLFLGCLFFIILIGYPILASSQERDIDWPLKTIEAFFSDPVKYFEALKKEPDLRNKLELYFRYNKEKARDGLRILLEQPDQARSEILVYLLAIYPEYVIADTAAEFFSLSPDLFTNQLKRYPEWRELINELTRREETFYAGLEKLGNTEFEREVKDYALKLKAQRDYEYKIISSFIDDPIKNYQKILGLRDFDKLIYEYQKKFIKNGILTDDPFGRLLDNLSIANEKTIEILIHLMSNIKSGYYAEELANKTARTFYSNTNLFINVLKRHDNWREIIDSMLETEWNIIMKTLPKLGQSEFERELKEYIKNKHDFLL
ncbi:MAG: hypothetical protein QME85_11740 [Candidatus Saccharicenans sp.]|nr:hypothetical protein [Candidatus Saccharicenans sp.]